MPVWGRYDAVVWRSFPAREQRVANGRYYTADINKVAFQQDEKTYWRLVDVVNPGVTATPVWEQMPSAELPGLSVRVGPVVLDNVTTLRVTGATITDAGDGSVQFTVSGGGGNTNLTYAASPTQGVVESDTGTDAVIPPADIVNAGLMRPVEHLKVGLIIYDDDSSTIGLTDNTGSVMGTIVGIGAGAMGGVAVGGYASAEDGVAVGANAEASGYFSTAIGRGAAASAAGSVAVGSGASVDTPRRGAVFLGDPFNDAPLVSDHSFEIQTRAFGGNVRLGSLFSRYFQGANPGEWVTLTQLRAGAFTGDYPVISAYQDLSSGERQLGFLDAPTTPIIQLPSRLLGAHGAKSVLYELVGELAAKGLLAASESNFTGFSFPYFWQNQTAGVNVTEFAELSSPACMRFRMPRVTGGGGHHSWFYWNINPLYASFTNFYSTLSWSGPFVGGWRHFGVALRNADEERAIHLTLTMNGSGLFALGLSRWNTAGSGSFIGETIVPWLSQHPFYRVRFERSGTTIGAFSSVDGEAWDFIAEHTDSWISGLNQVGFFIQRESNQDLTGYCYECRFS